MRGPILNGTFDCILAYFYKVGIKKEPDALGRAGSLNASENLLPGLSSPDWIKE